MAFGGGNYILILQLLIFSLIGLSQSELKGFDLCSCSMRYEPVCGSDGITYTNLCFLQCERFLHKQDLRSVSGGPCKGNMKNNLLTQQAEPVESIDLCRCSNYFSPICGSDGKTYQNECHFECQKFYNDHTLWKVLDGECVAQVASNTYLQRRQAEYVCNCSTRYKPVCGFDGSNYVLYRNKCLMQCVMALYPKLHIVETENCRVDIKAKSEDNIHIQKPLTLCNCTFRYNPVCAYNGKLLILYKNRCLFECVKIYYPNMQLIDIENCRVDRTNGLGVILQDDDPCFCPSKHQPICGSDGSKYITYQNYCVYQCMKLKYPRLRVVHNGECISKLEKRHVPVHNKTKSMCKCPETFDMVCGTDGLTYRNPCLLQCTKLYHKYDLRIDYKGRCEYMKVAIMVQDIEYAMCNCSNIYDPVCGSDGNSYLNECYLQCIQSPGSDLMKIHDGKCIEQQESKEISQLQQKIDPNAKCDCPGNYEMVCGTDGKTYRNPCLLQCAKIYKTYDLRIDYKGRCEYMKVAIMVQDIEYDPPPVLGCACPSEVVPVCGSDSTTYRNKCWFDCQKSHYNHVLWIVYVGRCRGTVPKPELQIDQGGYSCNCSTYYKPVCASDGRTYINQCLFGCQLFFKKDLWIVHDGECFFTHSPDNVLLPKTEAINMCNCSNSNRPVCGSDGRSYFNECYLQCIKSLNGDLSKIHDGICTVQQESKYISQLQTCLQKINIAGFALSCDCPKANNPICGSDNVTYKNPCELECVNNVTTFFCNSIIWKNYDGECRYTRTSGGSEAIVRFDDSVPIDPLCICPKYCSPVCGSDGMTYVNECQLNCKRRKENLDVYKVHNGYCLS